MTKFKIFLSLLTFIIFFNKQSFAMDPRCFEFIDGLKNLKYETSSDTSNFQYTTFLDLGFEFQYDQIIGVDFSSEEDAVKIRRNKDNNPIIGLITHKNFFDKLKNNDVLISINNFKLSELNDSEIEEIIWPDEAGINYKLVLERDGQIFQTNIESIEYKKESRLYEFVLNSINEINLKDSTVRFSGFLSADRNFSETVGWSIVEHAKKTISYFDKEDEIIRGEDCLEIPYNYAKENRMPIAGETFSFNNLISEDQDKVYETVAVYTYDDDTTDKLDDIELYITYYAEGEWEIKNNFNLVSFPFDKQKITITMVDSDRFDNVYLNALDTNYKILDYTKNNLKIPGWKITDVSFNTGNNFELSGLVFSEASIIVDIERESFYYIFKIILPIVLILIICWSSVWLDPKEVEAKLTISIVCLLSLIAYNFVIDNELPKLEYLTIMDWIILASYLFAAAPNILAIITFQINKKIKNRKLSSKIDILSKKFGLTSYILLILLIVIINVSTVPENTINSLSWAMMK